MWTATASVDHETLALFGLRITSVRTLELSLGECMHFEFRFTLLRSLLVQIVHSEFAFFVEIYQRKK